MQVDVHSVWHSTNDDSALVCCDFVSCNLSSSFTAQVLLLEEPSHGKKKPSRLPTPAVAMASSLTQHGLFLPPASEQAVTLHGDKSHTAKDNPLPPEISLQIWILEMTSHMFSNPVKISFGLFDFGLYLFIAAVK